MYKQSAPSVGCSTLLRQSRAIVTCSFCSSPFRIVTWISIVVIALHNVFLFNRLPVSESQSVRQEEVRIRSERVHMENRPDTIVATFEEDTWKDRAKVVQMYRKKLVQHQDAKERALQCPYPSFAKLSEEQKMPNTANERHMVVSMRFGAATREKPTFEIMTLECTIFYHKFLLSIHRHLHRAEK